MPRRIQFALSCSVEMQAMKHLLTPAVMVVAASFMTSAQQPPPQGRGGQGGRGGGGGGFARAFPDRPPGDPAAIERGKALYGVNCAFCHGADTRGGDSGPSLLRSSIVLDDQRGELIA